MVKLVSPIRVLPAMVGPPKADHLSSIENLI